MLMKCELYDYYRPLQRVRILVYYFTNSIVLFRASLPGRGYNYMLKFWKINYFGHNRLMLCQYVICVHMN